jgi:hypothetical protein
MGKGELVERVKAVWILMGAGATLVWVAIMQFVLPLHPVLYLLGGVGITWLVWRATNYLDEHEEKDAQEK